jgi:hypothetical protein
MAGRSYVATSGKLLLRGAQAVHTRTYLPCVAYRDNHIASACYLAFWCGPTGQLRVVRPPSSESFLKRPKRVGFRPNFWGDDREVRRVAEEHLNRIESDAGPALKRLATRWPLKPGSRDWRAILFLIAVHLRRNPNGRRQHQQVQTVVLRRSLPRYQRELGNGEIDKFLTMVSSDAFYAETMLDNLNLPVSVLGSMHMTLLECDDDLLATSDQPVTLVPLLEPGQRAEVGSPIANPLFDCQEIRFAIGPRHALLFTWLDEPSDEGVRYAGDDVAAQLNRAVIAQADKEWFHHPNRRPTTLTAGELDSRICRPIAPMLLPGYGSQYASASRRRADATSAVLDLLESGRPAEVRITRVAHADSQPARAS